MVAESPQIAPKLPQITIPEPRTARRLTLQDVEAIAVLVARRKLNESEACHALGINPQQWYNFKARNKNADKYESIVTRTRGLTINHAMERIEIAGQKDWRADHARLGLIDPQRFGQQSGQSAPQQAVINVGDSAIRAVLDKVYAQAKLSEPKPATVISCPEVKQLDKGQ